MFLNIFYGLFQFFMDVPSFTFPVFFLKSILIFSGLQVFKNEFFYVLEIMFSFFYVLRGTLVQIMAKGIGNKI
jgi:cytochrome b subunit of formate dehydrogenase